MTSLLTLLIGLALVPAQSRSESASLTPEILDAIQIKHTDTVYEPAAYETLDAWQEKREGLEQRIRMSSGLIPEPPRTPLRPRIFDRFTWEGISIEKVMFESMPGVYVIGNLFRPLEKGRHPAVACPHGHWPEGRFHHDETCSVATRCIRLAQMGAVVFAYDMIGFGDSKKQFDHNHPRWRDPDIELWLIGSLQLQTWNSIRVLDFLQELPDVDGEKIGVTGASGGGTQTFILAAIDDRVQAAAPVNMISSTMQGGCICENAPLLRIGTNNMEIAAVYAPKPQLMISASGDWTTNTPRVEYPFVRGIYALYDAMDHISHTHVDAPHNYNRTSREAVYAFFATHLLGLPDDADTSEPEIAMPPVEKLRVLTEDNLPKKALDDDAYLASMKQEIREQTLKQLPLNEEGLFALREQVRVFLAFGISLPETGEADVSMEGPTWLRNGLSRTAAWHTQRRQSGLPRGARPRDLGSLLYALHEPNTGGLRDATLAAEEAVESGRVQFVSPFGLGEGGRLFAAAHPRETNKYFSTFNLSDAATFIREATPVSATRRIRNREINLLQGCRFLAMGDVGPAGLVVRAGWPDDREGSIPVRTAIDMNQFDATTDDAYLNELFIPGIQRVGGLPALAACAANGPLWLYNVHPSFDTRWVKQAAKINGVEVKITHEPATPEEIRGWLYGQDGIEG